MPSTVKTLRYVTFEYYSLWGINKMYTVAVKIGYLLNYLLTYSIEQSPSWEPNRFSASQEIPQILQKPKVHCRNHKCSPPFPILSHLDPVLKPTSHCLKIHFNIILPSKPGSPKWSLFLSFPHWNLVHGSSLLHTRYMPRQSKSSWFHDSTNIWWGVQIIKLLIT